MGALLGAPPYPLILMEFEVPLQRGAGFDPQHVIDLLRSRGYRAFWYDNRAVIQPHATAAAPLPRG